MQAAKLLTSLLVHLLFPNTQYRPFLYLYRYELLH